MAEDGARAREEALNGPMASFLMDYWIPLFKGLPGGSLAALKHDPDVPDEAITPEYMLEHFWIVGDPDYCTRRLLKLYDDLGGFGTLLILCEDWENDRSKWFRSKELLAKEIRPALPTIEA